VAKRDSLLRVALFSDSALPVLNGVSVSVDLLTKELRGMGHRVMLFCPSVPGHVDTEPDIARFLSIEWAPAQGYPIAVPPYSVQRARFRRFGADIIHTHTPWVVGRVGMQWANWAGKPLVSTYHTRYEKYAHYIPFLPKPLVRKGIHEYTKWYYDNVEHVITPSESSRKWLLRQQIETPISVIPTGNRVVEVTDREILRKQLGFSPGQQVMLYVGRIASEKNIHVLLDAARKVLTANPNAVLCFVGDGPERRALETRCADLGSRVRFVGFVGPDEVSGYYRAADVFVFASTSETQGLVVQEAMSNHLPVVIVEGGGTASMVRNGKNGIMVKNDVEALAQAAMAVLNDADLAERLRAQALLDVNKYTAAHMAERIVGIYQMVMDARSSRSA